MRKTTVTSSQKAIWKFDRGVPLPKHVVPGAVVTMQSALSVPSTPQLIISRREVSFTHGGRWSMKWTEIITLGSDGKLSEHVV